MNPDFADYVSSTPWMDGYTYVDKRERRLIARSGSERYTAWLDYYRGNGEAMETGFTKHRYVYHVHMFAFFFINIMLRKVGRH